MLIGKPICYRIERVAERKNRSFATIFYGPNFDMDLAVTMLESGYVRLKPNPDCDQKEVHEKYMTAAEKAKQMKLGMYDPRGEKAPDARRPYTWTTQVNVPELFKAKKGMLLEGVVDSVIPGATLRIYLREGGQSIMFHLGGVTTPVSKMNGEIIPYSREALYFCETRLLGRDVQLRLEAIDKFEALYGQCFVSGANIGGELLRFGLGRFVEWSANCSVDGASLRIAEQEAKSKNLRLWKNYVPPPVKEGFVAGVGWKGRVAEVFSGDYMSVVDLETESEKRVYVSSLRAPRMPRKNNPAEPGGWEAREALRQLCIGRVVTVIPDYVVDDREYCTVMKNNKDVGEHLLATSGVHSLIVHKAADSSRSSRYEALQAASAKANLQKRTLPSVPRWREAVNIGEAKKIHPFLLDAGPSLASIEAVRQFGCKFRLAIPKQTCQINVILMHVMSLAPEAPGNDLALAEAKKLLLHRDVQVTFHPGPSGINRVGAFRVRMALTHPTADGMSDVAEIMAARGAAIPASDASPKIVALAKEAQHHGLGLYAKNPEAFVPPVAGENVRGGMVKPGGEKETPRLALTDNFHVVITEVVDALRVYAQKADAGEALTAIALAIRECQTHPANAELLQVPGQAVIARWSLDGVEYRARTTSKVQSDGTVAVLFQDFGNVDTVKISDIRILSNTDALFSQPAMAQACELAFLTCDEETRQVCTDAIREWCQERGVYISMHGMEGGILRVSLWTSDPAGSTPIPECSVDAALLRAGYARVRSDRKRAKEYRLIPTWVKEAWEQAEAEAKIEHRGIWAHGDVGSDSENERI